MFLNALKKIFSSYPKIIFFLIIGCFLYTIFLNPLASANSLKLPIASGKEVFKNDGASFDTSNKSEGYIMAKYTGSAKTTIKLIIHKTGGTRYTYNIFKSNAYEVFPLTEGSGTYTLTIYEGIGGKKYAAVHSTTLTVELKDDLSPFLYPNQYVWFDENASIVNLTKDLLGKESDDFKKLKLIYAYVIDELAYDYDKISSLKSGYVCDIEDTLKSKKGICLDYSAVMAAMLRSQSIPTRLVVGYAETEYHAWISIYTQKSGWIENIIYFDGQSWTMMDPTKASSLKQPDFKVDPKKYSTKYAY